MKTTPQEREQLIAEATSAFRSRAADGQVLEHPAWMDLDEAGRVEAHERTLELRALERAASPLGHSSTVRAVLARIQAAQRR